MPISAANLNSQDLGFEITLNGRVWRWVTRMNVSGLTPTFQIVGILTPYGVFRDSVPLPGEVVTAMSESIATLQANFRPSLLVGPPTSLEFSVDEGRGLSQPQSGRVTNSGVFGSLLSCSLTSSASYIHVTPGVVGHLATNQYGQFSVTVDSSDLEAANSPYQGSVTIQGDTANSPQTLPVTITVRPLSVITPSVATLLFTVMRPLSGPFPSVPVQTFTVGNTGPTGAQLDYQVARLTGLSQNWLAAFGPSYGSLAAGSQRAVDVTVAPVEGLMPGVYEETLRISGYSLNSYADVLVRLTIT